MQMSNREIIDLLVHNRTVSDDQFKVLLSNLDESEQAYLYECARNIAQKQFGKNIYIRGLIEFSNYCHNDCYYCGLRASNREVERYRLSKEDVLACCQVGYEIGFRTFVLQAGEDHSYHRNMEDIIKSIRETYPDCAITLSLGEKDETTYRKYYEAGANRYLLRHETVNDAHYRTLHPDKMDLQNRLECITTLKTIGFQTGSGIMVGSPNQTLDTIIEDIHFLEALQPQMIGIGPFLPHRDTPFKDQAKGSLTQTLIILAMMRIMHPQALIPSTTALATLDPKGRLLGILAGANVVMPNLSPVNVRKQYSLYNDKASMGAEAAESLVLLQAQLDTIGYQISYDRGDFRKKEQHV